MKQSLLLVALLCACTANGNYASDTVAARGYDTMATDSMPTEVGWVTLSMQDSSAHAVYVEGVHSGFTTLELSQRVNVSRRYEIRDTAGRSLCASSLSVGPYEHACYECRALSKTLMRVACR